MKTIYLAGFDVFRQDAVAHGEALKQLCLRYGFEGWYPLDNSAPEHLSGRALAQWIYEANVDLIRRADLVMANMNPFRGHEPDSGTAFEVGYAIALDKPVFVYLDEAQSLVQRIAVDQRDDPPRHVDAAGYAVEDFGLNLNLMLACSATVVVGDAEQCLVRIAQSFDADPVVSGGDR
ncbi:nucleoside 2-deoxyribosyltransferase [Bordetella sp. 02P26C-1]|uniref:nucleoside 2-deoxyribosyltransferase n=1 Tax=Bordetella sp. 02P26C-1 TaxID=2683195 RepID=UPI001353D11C|nr:nucleoside 2-deoxyribosyltransferase [Bordetella sp. 02P26C-1]MVW78680.1 nucleoside 2-deoxyribosyltransferase [Bordetella sp. 02P26C-1]